MASRRRWSRDELLVVFNLYQKIPFGQISHRNDRIVELARRLDRTPSAVSMKMGNLASFDPTLTERGVKGLTNAARADREIFEEFHADTEALADESESALERLGWPEALADDTPTPPGGATETERVVRVRRVQRFFREVVLANYEGACAISGIRLSALLNASHIVPWSVDVPRRADPTNGIALCALYDRVFDRGLMTIDDDLRVVLSPRLLEGPRTEMHDLLLVNLSGVKLRAPIRATPDRRALEYHRSHVFVGAS